MAGLFIVIEGLDGSGGETQTKHLVEFLNNKGRETVVVSYPNPESPVGKVIYDYLNKQIELKPDEQMGMYIIDFALDREKIRKALADGKIVIANRYLFSTLAYQCGGKGVEMEKAMLLAEAMDLLLPDVVILLDITKETSMVRKSKENDALDRHEEDAQLLGKVREIYQNLAAERTFAKEWFVLNGEKSVAEVTSEIQQIVSEKL